MTEKTKIDVSVIIPVYRDQENLDRCLECLANQKTDMDLNWEVIIVNNDPAYKLTVKKSPRLAVQLICCPKPGSYSARNAGASIANGKILSFLDVDCEPAENWLENGAQALNRLAFQKIIGGEVCFTKSLKPTGVETYQLIIGFGQQSNVEKNLFSATANIFVTKKIFRRVGAFNEELLSGGDREWCWRSLALGFGIVFVPDVVVYTSPRRTLTSAIIQARRVAGGRVALSRKMPANEEFTARIYAKAGFINKSSRLLFANDHSIVLKLRAFGVAIILKIISDFEKLRLRFGGRAERR